MATEAEQGSVSPPSHAAFSPAGEYLVLFSSTHDRGLPSEPQHIASHLVSLALLESRNTVSGQGETLRAALLLKQEWGRKRFGQTRQQLHWETGLQEPKYCLASHTVIPEHLWPSRMLPWSAPGPTAECQRQSFPAASPG